MKCLSVQQPWAFGIISGPKRIENRTWLTHYRGPLLIHAGKSHARLGEEAGLFVCPPLDSLAFGAIIGVVELVDCVRAIDVRGEWADSLQGRYLEGPFCWLLRNPVAFAEPIPWKGQQGLFEVSRMINNVRGNETNEGTKETTMADKTTQGDRRMTDKLKQISGMMDTLSNLLRDAALDQRIAATRTLFTDQLTSDWYRDFPESKAAATLKNLLRSGRGVVYWLDEKLDAMAHGISTLIRQRGPGALNHSNRSDGSPVSDSEFARRVDAALGFFGAAIDALKGAGVVDHGPDATDRAFAQCGGSVQAI